MTEVVTGRGGTLNRPFSLADVLRCRQMPVSRQVFCRRGQTGSGRSNCSAMLGGLTYRRYSAITRRWDSGAAKLLRTLRKTASRPVSAAPPQAAGREHQRACVPPCVDQSPSAQVVIGIVIGYSNIGSILIRAHMHCDSDLRSGRMCATSIPWALY
eukprot:COSAG02_NODE_245_length_27293_cov_16.488012_18_plen_156_part_00